MKILLILLFLISLPAWSFSEDDFQMRVSWVKTLKTFFTELEKNEAEMLLTSRERSLLNRFRLFEEAWADSRYECFFAGWPSTLLSQGGKRLCTSPQRGNHEYKSGSCKQNELQCQPLLFGEGLCVSFANKADKQKAFSACEQKFQRERKGKYDFLKALSRDEAQNLREISLLAGDICQKGSKGVQKDSGMCKSLLKKMPHGLHSVEQAWKEATASASEEMHRGLVASASRAPASHTHENPEECARVHPDVKAVVEQVEALQATVGSSDDLLYEEIKQEFQASAFCDPKKVLSDPSDKPNALVMYRLLKDLNFMDSRHVNPINRFEQLSSKYGLSSGTSEKVKELLGGVGSVTWGGEEWRKLRARVQILILQDYSSQLTPRHKLTEEDLKAELSNLHIFSEDEKGNIECPFVGKDAFMKALAGHRKLKSRGDVTHKDQITIVDYTRPSNERRMFVIDLKTKKVLHNTWVAHGGGGGNGPGKDGFGSDPDMSNVSGSNKSSDGFIVATKASYGPLFGNNVLLKGIDQNNSNLARRAVIIHGWQSPMGEYTSGVRDYNWETESYTDPKDAVLELKRIELQSASLRDMERAVNRLRASTTVTDYLMPTEGCLGVPRTPVPQLDRKGRKDSQLELLRNDLPGSVIFNYSGPEMTSKYF